MIGIPNQIASYAAAHSIDQNPEKKVCLSLKSWIEGATIKVIARCQKKAQDEYIQEQLLKKISGLDGEKASYLLLNFSEGIIYNVLEKLGKNSPEGAKERIQEIFVRLVFKASAATQQALISKADEFLNPSSKVSKSLDEVIQEPLKTMHIQESKSDTHLLDGSHSEQISQLEDRAHVGFQSVVFKKEEWNRLENPNKDLVVLQNVTDPTQPFTLYLAQGSITANHIGGEVGVTVNAANNTLFYGGAGTNLAYSQIIPQKSWETDAKNFFNNREKKSLDVSECVLFEWNPVNSEDEKIVHAKYFAQLLGPVVDKTKLKESQQQVYEAYKNLFQQAREKGLSSVQMPFLSCGIYAASLPPEDKAVWLTMVDEAIFRAISEEMQEKGGVSTVVLVDYGRVPWTNYLE